MNEFFILTKEDLENAVENAVDKKFREYSPKKENTKEPEYITRQEVAERLHISLVTLHRITNLGIIKSYKIGGRVLYRADEVTQAITEQLKKYRR